MIFGWFKKKTEDVDELAELDFGQKPIYNEEEREFKTVIDEILMKLNEIQMLVNKLKQEEKNGDSTGNS
jgi:hypothetical protein